MSEERRFEPWPLALALMLLAMIGASLSFYAIAHLHPDPPVARPEVGRPAGGR